MTIPVNAKRIPLRPLALGEKTGHHHSLISTGGTAVEDEAQMFELTTEDGVKHYLRVTGDNVALEHQEHKPHAIPPGDYEIVIQQEETDWGSRKVLD
jgi:hypothetical protein